MKLGDLNVDVGNLGSLKQLHLINVGYLLFRKVDPELETCCNELISSVPTQTDNQKPKNLSF